MTPITFLLLATSLVAAVFAAPTQPKKRSFKVDRVRQANYVPNGHAALRKAYVKFGLDDITFLPNANTAAEIDAETAGSSGTESEIGEVSASPTQNDAEFLSPVSVGGQTIVMDFDTGSSDMWVFNTQLSSQSQSGHTIFDPTKSSTFQSLDGATFNITYGDGSFAEGPVGLDTVDIGGATVTQQAIGLPTLVADSFVSDMSSNGLVGLAFSKLNTVQPQQQKTFFDNVMNDLEQPVFTANLKHGVAGAYEFGSIDDTQFTGSLTQVPVDSSQGFWEFATTQIAVGSDQAQTIQGGSGTAIADTGTSLLIVDDAIVEAYYAQVDGAQNSASAGGVIFPCTSTLPSLSLAVGDSYMAVVNGSLLNFSDAGTDQETGENCEFFYSLSV
jgi:Eukaryotic aspartyl protease